MHQLEYHPVLIESHRRYLRDLFHRQFLPDPAPTRRERLGRAIVRFGHWVAQQYPDVSAEPAGAQPGLSRP